MYFTLKSKKCTGNHLIIIGVQTGQVNHLGLLEHQRISGQGVQPNSAWIEGACATLPFPPQICCQVRHSAGFIAAF